jgi:hypothetical protein
MEAKGAQANFPIFFRLTQIRCRMFWSTEANVLCNNLSNAMTYELIGRDGEPWEPSRSSLDTLGPMALEDPGPRVTSPRVVLLGTPMPAPCITKSRSKPRCCQLVGGRHHPP